MRTTRALLLMAAVAFCSLAGLAQEVRKISGRVKPARNYDCGKEKLGWTNITVKVASRGRVILPLQRSKNEDWSHPKVPVGANVAVGFFFNCYRPWRIVSYDVTAAQSQSLPDAVMSPMDICTRCSNQVRAQSENQARVSARIESIDTPIFKENRNASVDYSEAAAVENEPSPEELLKTIQEDAAIAKEFDALDIFQYNFEVLRLGYARNAGLTGVLNKFQTENLEFFNQRRSRAFQNVIEKNILGRGTFDAADAMELAQDTSVDPSIRGSAVVALLDSELNPDQNSAFLAFLRANASDKNSEVYLTSVIALARQGTDEDRNNIASNVTSTDADVASAALSGIRVAWITNNTSRPFTDSISSIAHVAKSSSDAELREAAVLALRPAALYFREKTAIRTFTDVLKEDGSYNVRVEAAAALGLGNLENRPDVRLALLKASREDASPEVREMANKSLTGRIPQ